MSLLPTKCFFPLLMESLSVGICGQQIMQCIAGAMGEVLQHANDLNTEEATSNLPMNESAIVGESSEIKEKPRKKAKRKRRRLCKPPKRREDSALSHLLRGAVVVCLCDDRVPTPVLQAVHETLDRKSEGLSRLQEKD
ncbi:hypothetical protein CEXT_145531 [Caerostris extrusa]|uniref:Uncharacterized protein n=1 Tax=Caerostris extrusa TaxID=172846 RepID=A0AAV4R7J4_CAEEX|nr:hypothetical protein CEXT_145531 [Caerostris extrusa]